MLLEDEHLLAGLGERDGGGEAARAGSNDNGVDVVAVNA